MSFRESHGSDGIRFATNHDHSVPGISGITRTSLRVSRPCVIVVRPRAREDIAEAAVWYELRAEGLGIRFRSVVVSTLSAIAGAPEQFRVVRPQT